MCVISPEVIAEAAAGDAALAEQRKAALLELPLVSGGKEGTKLAADLMSHNLFPPNARSDALHLPIATCAEVDYLLTSTLDVGCLAEAKRSEDWWMFPTT